jgi:hypothetical protein
MGWESETEEVPLTPEQEAELKAVVRERAPSALSELESASSDQDRFYALPAAAMAAYHLERFDLAAELANDALRVAPKYPDDWNYGNALHAGHSILGLLALRAGDRDESVRQLHDAGAMKGSPQLDTFGPSMLLARELLRTGEEQAVLTYLQQCRKFWRMGGTWLDIWEAKIRAGEVPNFVMGLYR